MVETVVDRVILDLLEKLILVLVVVVETVASWVDLVDLEL